MLFVYQVFPLRITWLTVLSLAAKSFSSNLDDEYARVTLILTFAGSDRLIPTAGSWLPC